MSTKAYNSKYGFIASSQAGLFSDSADPSTGGGYSAPVGSLLLRTNGFGYKKFGTNNTDWRLEFYTRSFTNSDLSSGILSITHNLGLTFVNISIFDNSNRQITPDEFTVVNSSSANLDISSYGTISGTWNLIVR